MSVSHEREPIHEEAGGDAETREFLTLLAGLPWLLRQYFADSVNLLETEGRLAVRSLLMLLGLTLLLAGLVAGAWLVLVAFLVWLAAENGLAPWAIGVGLLVLHVLAVAAVVAQMKVLARYLFFPNSRRAFTTLISREQSPLNP